MQAILFYIVIFHAYCISIQPFWVLYRYADILYFLLYHVFGYRKKVIFENLTRSFPEKDEAEIRKIARQYYRHMADLILESFKLITISKKQVAKRCRFNDLSLFERYADSNQHIIIVMGHLGNWELAGHAMQVLAPNEMMAIYRPLSNKYFDRFMRRLRTRFGGSVVEMNEVFRKMLRYPNSGSIGTVFIADQTPQPDKAYWTTFLNQPTPVFLGTEKIAKKVGQPVIYAAVNKRKRGYYEINLQLISEDPTSTTAGELSEAHTRLLEQDILTTPYNWLWSHRRWKHKPPANVISSQ